MHPAVRKPPGTDEVSVALGYSCDDSTCCCPSPCDFRLTDSGGYFVGGGGSGRVSVIILLNHRSVCPRVYLVSLILRQYSGFICPLWGSF